MAVSVPAPAAGKDAIARRNIIAAIAMVFGADCAMGLTYPLLNLLLEQRGVDERLIGLNAAMSPLGLILAGLILPRLVARMNSAPIAWAGLIALAIILLALGVFSSLEAWFALRFLLGMATGALFSLSEAWLMHFTPDSQRGRITAIYTTVMALGFGAGTFILPFTGTDGLLPFIVGTVLVSSSAIPMLFLKLDGREFEPSEEETEQGGKSKANMWRFGIAAPILLFGVLSMTLFDSVMLSFFPIYAVRLDMDLNRAAWLLGTAVAGAAIFQLPIGWLADKWSRHGVVWIATVGTFVLSLSMPYVIMTWAAWPLAIALGTCAYAIYALALVAMGDRFKGPMLVAGSAAVAAMWGIGGVFGPAVTGWVFKLVGHDALPWVLAAPYAFFTVCLLVSGGHLVRAKWRG